MFIAVGPTTKMHIDTRLQTILVAYTPSHLLRIWDPLPYLPSCGALLIGWHSCTPRSCNVSWCVSLPILEMDSQEKEKLMKEIEDLKEEISSMKKSSLLGDQQPKDIVRECLLCACSTVFLLILYFCPPAIFCPSLSLLLIFRLIYPCHICYAELCPCSPIFVFYSPFPVLSLPLYSSNLLSHSHSLLPNFFSFSLTLPHLMESLSTLHLLPCPPSPSSLSRCIHPY